MMDLKNELIFCKARLANSTPNAKIQGLIDKSDVIHTKHGWKLIKDLKKIISND